MISHSLTPGISGDQITTSNLVNSGQAAHNYGSAGNNYMIAQTSPVQPSPAQSSPVQLTSFSSLMIVIDPGVLGLLGLQCSPPCSLHYLPARENMSAKFQ